MTPRTSRVASAAVLALVLASVGAVAQGTGGAALHPHSVQSVGTLRVEGIADAPTPLYGFGFAVTNTGTASGGGGGAGKAEFQQIEVTRLPDASSTALFRGAATGTHYGSVKIEISKAGTGSASSYLLSDAQVTSFSHTDGVEQVSFAYRRIEVTAEGTTTCFDLATNAVC